MERITTGKGLQPGNEITCDVCGTRHVVRAGSTLSDTSTAAREMLYVFCPKPRPGEYYVGTIGGRSNRGPTVRGTKGGA